MEHDNQVFESITRRRALAEMLGIPLVLFGLASSSTIRPLEERAPGMLLRASVDRETIEQYSEVSKLYWSLYYSGPNTNLSANISRNIQKLHSILPDAGDMRYDVIEQLSSFYDLASRVSMDQFSPQQSTRYIEEALSLVDPDNVELYGKLLYKKGMALYESKNFGEAQLVLEQAHTLIPRLSVPLAGSILLQLALVRSYQLGEGSHRSTSMALFDQSGKLVRDPRCVEVEGVRLDEGRYLTAYGEGLINLGRYEDAEYILELARAKTSPDFTKRLLLVDVQGVRLFVAQKEYPVTRVLAEEARDKAVKLKSPRITQTIEEILRPLPLEKRRRS